MAQYRAIFQNAYFKGLATAAVLTAGLAVGQAQAATSDENLDADELASATGQIEITGTTTDKGTDNKWGALNISGAATTTIGQDLKITGGAKASNYITSDDTDDAVVTGKALTIEVKADKAKDNGLTIKAGTQSGAKAVFTDAHIKIGSLDINAADSTKAGALEANTITIGSAPKADAKAAPATLNAYVTLGKSGSIGIEATDSGDLSKLTTLTLNQ